MKNTFVVKSVLVVMVTMMSVIFLSSTGCSPKSPKNIVRPDFSKAVKIESLGKLAPPPVDILFIIDNSGSMADHQTNLSTNIDLFINAMGAAQMDYHIAVITSDNGAFFGSPKVITSTTTNGISRLRDNIKVGIGGEGVEIFFDYIDKALSASMLSGVNSGFYRQEALLAIMIVTDTDDQGSLSGSQLYKNLVKLKGDPNLLTVYGVITAQSATNRCANEQQSPGNRISDFLVLAKGSKIDLCDPNYGKKLADVGKDIKSKAPQYVMLKQIPVVSTIRVTYGSQTIPNDADKGWVYDPNLNRLSFGRNLKLNDEPQGTELQVYFVPADL